MDTIEKRIWWQVALGAIGATTAFIADACLYMDGFAVSGRHSCTHSPEMLLEEGMVFVTIATTGWLVAAYCRSRTIPTLRIVTVSTIGFFAIMITIDKVRQSFMY